MSQQQTSIGPEENKKEYWQTYYASHKSKSLPLPSQFSVFVAGELDQKYQVYDIGCGGGRDSLLFASHGHAVVGVDGSPAAVESCAALAEHFGLEGASFVSSSITNEGLPQRVRQESSLPALIYARFFLHAITDEEERSFFSLTQQLSTNGALLAVEFRTMRDVAQEKVTGAHYRRFIDPLDFMARAKGAGFKPRYFVEGFGFAKYKKDDAHVARFLFDRE